MTSTSTYQGMDSDSKPSSRVLAPPGGGSSNIFGSAEPVRAPPKREPAAAAPPKPAEPAAAQSGGQGDRFVRAAPKQAYNPITGMPYDQPEQKKTDPAAAKDEEEKVEGKENGQKKNESPAKPAVAVAAKEKTSTRIAQPPGGKSSGLW